MAIADSATMATIAPTIAPTGAWLAGWVCVLGLLAIVLSFVEALAAAGDFSVGSEAAAAGF